MDCVEISGETDGMSTGEVRLVGREVMRELMGTAEQDGFLCVALSAPGPGDRGDLAVRISDAIETALERRGACSPGIAAASDLDATLSDQLYRARLVELSGVAVGLPTLEGITNLAGALDAEDSAVLRWWMAATGERPLRLYVDAVNRSLGVYDRPLPLFSLLDVKRRSASEAVPELAPEIHASSVAMELSQTPPPVQTESEAAPAPLSVPALDVVALMLAESELRIEHAQAASSETKTAEPPPAEAASPAHERVLPEFPRGPLYANAAEDWPTWLSELEGARGPKPLAAIERMFVTCYVPLRDALARGIAEPRAARTLDTWATSFEKSYKEAFDALRVRGKRPTMVLDAPEIALRIARLHGARSVQLVLVDGMRFDLGLLVEQRVRAALGQNAALAERLLLWAALPTTTSVQLELLGRGPEALREFSGEAVDSEPPVARGRMASTLRRVKASHRELLKLDLVESRLSEPGGSEANRLDDLADDTAAALTAYMQRLPSRTLVLVFGDHGFLLDPLDEGTTRARQGGASPEEVLVPAFAWLVGGVH